MSNNNIEFILVGYSIKKTENKFTTKEGEEKISYRLSFSQTKGGKPIELTVKKEFFSQAEDGKDYVLTCRYGKGMYGNYLQIVGISDIKEEK